MKKVAKYSKKKKLVKYANAIEYRVAMHQALLKNIKARLPDLEEFLTRMNGHWTYEDYFYRFYHTSFKVFYVQNLTITIVEVLRYISPLEDKDMMDKDFLEIVRDGTGKVFKLEDNGNWTKVCRPMLEAFAHAKFFLEMAVKYGKELDTAPECLPSGWAALLYLYNIR